MSHSTASPVHAMGAQRPPFGSFGDALLIHKHIESVLAPVLERLESILSRLGDTTAPEPHLTVSAFALSVGRSEYRVRAWIKDKRIKAVKTAGTGPRSRWLIPRSELQRLLNHEVAVE